MPTTEQIRGVRSICAFGTSIDSLCEFITDYTYTIATYHRGDFTTHYTNFGPPIRYR